MKKGRYTLLCAMVAMLSASCGVYHPQLAEIPLIDHKGDVRFSAKISTPSAVSMTIMAITSFFYAVDKKHILQK